VKLPKTFMPEKDLEGLTEDLLEEKDMKPKLDNSITLIDEVLEELDNNPKYSDSSRFHSSVYVAINQKGYALLGGRTHINSNTYFVKPKKDSDSNNVFIKVLDNNRIRYYFAVTKHSYLSIFTGRFDEYMPKKKTLSLKGSLTQPMNAFFTVYISALGAYVAYDVIAKALNAQPNAYHTIGSMIAGLGMGCFASWFLRRRAFKENEKVVKSCCEEIIIDEKAAIRRALSA